MNCAPGARVRRLATVPGRGSVLSTAQVNLDVSPVAALRNKSWLRRKGFTRFRSRCSQTRLSWDLRT